MGSDPTRSQASAMQATVSRQSGGALLYLTYPRRVGVPAEAFAYEISADLQRGDEETAFARLRWLGQ